MPSKIVRSSPLLPTIVGLAILAILPGGVSAVGPELRARARLLRDLSLLSGLQGQLQHQEEDARLESENKRRTLIDVSLAVRSIDLDMDNGIFKTDGWMSLRWRDPRYSWDPADYSGIESATLPFSKFWAPELILHNSVEEKFIYRQVGMVKHRGEFVYIIAVHTRSACEPNFDGFPFGMQDCRLTFGSWVNEDYNVEYRIAPNETVALDDFSSPTGWKIVATTARLESRQFPLFEEPSHTVVFDLAFRKDKHFDKASGKLLLRDEEEL